MEKWKNRAAIVDASKHYEVGMVPTQSNKNYFIN